MPSTTGACQANRQRNKLFLTLRSDPSRVTWEANADEELSIQGAGAVAIRPIRERDKRGGRNLRPQFIKLQTCDVDACFSRREGSKSRARKFERKRKLKRDPKVLFGKDCLD